jgi:L-malate glycosyltransferase
VQPPVGSVVAFIWSNFGPYHIDRLEAAAAALAPRHRVVGIEVAGASGTYAWARTEAAAKVERITLFPHQVDDRVPWWRQFLALLRACLASRAHHVFVCHYEQIQTFLLALLLWLSGRRLYVMVESKFDDKPRRLWRECLKVMALLPYGGGLAGGGRSRDYLRMLGFSESRIELGYDTVSIERVQRLAGTPPAPEGVAFAARNFIIVARLVPKKNIATALDAYARYCQDVGNSARGLYICGDGPLAAELKERARELNLQKVAFQGFLQAPEIARLLASSLALILPSTEEQWGLVVNEALAMGLPILCSSNAGACDLLVRTAVNGFVFEPDNIPGLAGLMQLIAHDEENWRRMAMESRRLAELGDIRQFGAGAARLVGTGQKQATDAKGQALPRTAS